MTSPLLASALSPLSSLSSHSPLLSAFTRCFSMSSDKLRRSRKYEHIPAPTFSLKTLRKQRLARLTPHYMSHEEYQRCRRPFPAPVVTKLPLSHRAPSVHSLRQQLEREEQARILTSYPSHRDSFHTGDRVCVTKYVSLSDRQKVERVTGLVIARNGGRGLNAMFTVRNVKLEEAYEIQFPLYSPFIVRIDVLERRKGRSGVGRAKIFHVRDRDRREYETVLTDVLPKTADGVRVYAKGSVMALRLEKEKNEKRRKEKEQQRQDRQTAQQVQAAETQ